ncbi:hypothetical protein AB4562_18830 [Vibrio sp. 10N.222.54.A1]|nr:MULTISPECIES: hypothetical protein [Vibrio]MBB1466337.1 hypothetical protein [Vibrio sp. SG41-7]PMH14969.1 hypothetical protein BCU77_23200 [Vibrio splendidus]PMK78004.1 hypothetical protein BCT92_03655 [Vibrio sp. 10N.261.52.E5]TKF83062.1 hypothetical protein FCV65_12915 [Vibrio sp. F13]
MLKIIACATVLVVMTGCTSPTILSESKDKELSLSNEILNNECVIVPLATGDGEKLTGALTAFVVDAAATLLIDEIQTRLENAAKQQVMFKNSTFIGVSNSGLADVNCEQKVTVTHNGTTSHGVQLVFNNANSLPLIRIQATSSDGDTIPLPKGWKKATASLSLKWKTIYSKGGIVKTSQTTPIVVAEFKSKDDGKPLTFIEQSKPIMLQAPSAPTDAPSVHVLTYTFTMVESTNSKLLGQLAKSLKKQKGAMVDEINKAYIESLDDD